jgi:hypothetical protein
MRPALAKPLASAGVAALLALVSANGALAEDAQFEDVQSDGTQIVAAGVADERLPAKNLNSVPIDGFSSPASDGADGPLVRQLTAARPNEDLVICVAGCFADRDRVVYAQPIDRQANAKAAAAKQNSNGASDGTSGSIAQSLRGSQ